jgi:hypothetical protein
MTRSNPSERNPAGAPRTTPSRRAVARALLAGLLLPVAACADRLPGSEGDPMTARQRCMSGLRRMGQLSAKPAGRCD